jgi:hypothetical protein
MHAFTHSATRHISLSAPRPGQSPSPQPTPSGAGGRRQYLRYAIESGILKLKILQAVLVGIVFVETVFFFLYCFKLITFPGYNRSAKYADRSQTFPLKSNIFFLLSNPACLTISRHFSLCPFHPLPSSVLEA